MLNHNKILLKTESFNGEAVINLVLRTFLREILGTRLPVSRDLLLVREPTNYLSDFLAIWSQLLLVMDLCEVHSHTMIFLLNSFV